ncbi:DNA-binding NarL/FixJ family response regulator [Crossiella equi]|uniref:DNA-binding NarL/FixJ family response regulator n=1 Tax=Crossiella equi TaxID=130796 RepID=A0ABS5AMC7_9PSEU|nr:hypothetical protein [Crossiella equi]MBP2477721.1 DNA-binding NarL/FixJ family response regulator [Crossiella equi]
MREASDADTLTRRLADVRVAISTTLKQLSLLKAEEYGIALSLARLTGSALPQRPTAPEVTEHPRVGRRQRLTPEVRRVLQESAAALTRHEIAERLSTTNTTVEVNAVSASLSYLRRLGVVANIDGSWIAIEPANSG